VQGVIATDQAKRSRHLANRRPVAVHFDRGRTSTNPSRSSATKCDHSAFFPQQPTAPVRLCPNRFFTCLFSRRRDSEGAILPPSIPNTLTLSAPRSSNLMLDRLLYDQPSRRRPISLIDHTKKKKTPCRIFFFSHTCSRQTWP
jgi:hypothetical protein